MLKISILMVASDAGTYERCCVQRWYCGAIIIYHYSFESLYSCNGKENMAKKSCWVYTISSMGLSDDIFCRNKQAFL